MGIVCDHKNFEVKVEVNRLSDVGKFNMDVKVHCTDCGQPFKFKGLPVGVNLNGATCSFDGLEGRFAIEPKVF